MSQDKLVVWYRLTNEWWPFKRVPFANKTKLMEICERYALQNGLGEYEFTITTQVLTREEADALMEEHRWWDDMPSPAVEAPVVPEALLSRSTMLGLIQSLPDQEAVIWRTLEGEYTAAQMAALIEAGDAVGSQYASDLLILARDLLMRSARKRKPSLKETVDRARLGVAEEPPWLKYIYACHDAILKRSEREKEAR